MKEPAIGRIAWRAVWSTGFIPAHVTTSQPPSPVPTPPQTLPAHGARPLPPVVQRLLAAWLDATRKPAGRLVQASLILVLFGGAHLARLGTPAARAAMGAALLLVLAGWVAMGVRRRRIERDLRKTIRLLTSGPDRALGDKALRALALAEQSGRDPDRGSPELAELHLARLLNSLPEARVREQAERRGARLQMLATALAMMAMGAVAVGPVRVIEGLDVLLARDGVAPMPFAYLDEARLEIHPPEYLRLPDLQSRDLEPISVPSGSLVTVRGAALHAGRKLVLTDGKSEVPFVEDGAGGLLARWSVDHDVMLRVAARHGQVKIEQSDELTIKAIADAPPIVELKDAPRVVRLIEESEIPIQYRATDDHGLREINLVMRVGGHEERRVLAKLDGETRQDTGGFQLRSTEKLLRRSFLPIEVTVEARDNDPLTGPKWGKSPAITVLPPAIGAPEAERYEALIEGRNALVDYLAERAAMTTLPTTAAERRVFASAELARLEATLAKVFSSLDVNVGGVRVARRMAAFIEGQARKLREAVDLEQKSINQRTSAGVLTAAENAVLAVDRSVRTLGNRDAQASAKRLSRVAAEVADGLLLASSSPNDKDQGLARAKAALDVVEPSGKALARLGVLGADLGSIVANDVRRVRKAMDGGDLFHAELAARDLAARLSRPLPSFSGGGRGNNTEAGSGGKNQQPADDGASGDEDGSEGEEAGFGAEAQALQEISRDHAGNIEDVQQSLQQPGDGAENDALMEQAKRHAEAVRDAVRSLPRPQDDASPSSAAREQAGQMANALERGDLKDALDSGKAAMESLKGAMQAAEREGSNDYPLNDAARKLSPELTWAEEALDKQRKERGQRANAGEAGEREQQLADRARALLETGRSSAGNLPGSSLDALQAAEEKMREAAGALKKGDTEKAIAQQRDAQRLLEQAQPPTRDEGESDGPGDREGTGKEPSFGPSHIPDANAHKGPEDYRRRVVDGLKQGQSSGLRQAIRRYAERLLR